MCKHGAKKLPYLLRYVPDWSRTQQMCDKAILENGRTIKFVPGCYKNQEMCDKAVDNYPHALEFVRECYKAQEICQLHQNLFLIGLLQVKLFRYFLLLFTQMKIYSIVMKILLMSHLLLMKWVFLI